MATPLRRLRHLAVVTLALLPSAAALRSRAAQEVSKLKSEASPVRQQLANYSDLHHNGSNLTDCGKVANYSDVQQYHGSNLTDVQQHSGSNLTIGGKVANNSDSQQGKSSNATGKRRGDDLDTSVSKASPLRQQLANYRDLQYYGNLTIGGQNMTGLLDTGSFELVVFSKQCKTCGIAGVYDEKNSSAFTRGVLTQVHAYGSGKCRAIDGSDTVEVGAFGTVAARGLSSGSQAMWLAEDCTMPLLKSASFNAIVGIGPPGQPEYSAKRELDKLKKKAKGYRDSFLPVPDDLEDQISEKELELKIAKGKPSMLENFDVTTFSHCLGKDMGSPGWLFWNDDTRKGEPGVLEIPVSGRITWSINAMHMAFDDGADADIVACRDGCGALVDTGTSMFAVPTEIYDDIFGSVNNYIRAHRSDKVRPDCKDLSTFPDLVMYFGSDKLSFPPSSYLGLYYGQMSKEVSQFVRMDALEGTRCKLLLMDLGKTQETFMGPQIILGMPFFREYYTTFDLGSGKHTTRSLFVSKAGESCEPAGAYAETSADRSGARHRAYAYQPRQVDVSKLRVPNGLDRLEGEL